MTNPHGPPDDPTAWGRPANKGSFGDQPTERYRGQAPGGQSHQPTMPGKLPGRTEQFGASRANAQQPGYPPPVPPGRPRTQPVAPPQEPATPKKKKRSWRDPLSIFLVLIIVVALVVAGLIGAELYVRNKASNKIAEAAACKTMDSATAKFGVTPLVLWQVATDHFSSISVETAGNQLKDAKGMKLQLDLKDVRITNSPDAKGTIGSIDATLTWTAEGIKETIKDSIHGLGGFLFSSVATKPNDGTLQLKGMLDNVVIKPVVSGGGIRLEIISFNVVGGISVGKKTKEEMQSKLDEYTSDVTKKLPLGIQADRVEVTSTGVVAHFAAQNATIPAGKSDDPCFANL